MPMPRAYNAQSTPLVTEPSPKPSMPLLVLINLGAAVRVSSISSSPLPKMRSGWASWVSSPQSNPCIPTRSISGHGPLSFAVAGVSERLRTRGCRGVGSLWRRCIHRHALVSAQLCTSPPQDGRSLSQNAWRRSTFISRCRCLCQNRRRDSEMEELAVSNSTVLSELTNAEEEDIVIDNSQVRTIPNQRFEDAEDESALARCAALGDSGGNVRTSTKP